MWDVKQAASLLDEEGDLAIFEEVPWNKREGALELLAKRSYVPGDDFLNAVNALPTHNGSDWSNEKKTKFSECVFSYRKNLHEVGTAMGIDMASCLAHYYGIFKHTDEYRLVKTVIRAEKRDNNAAVQEGEPDACVICDDGGELLICDGCDREYHRECLDPPLRSVPEGHWECDECVNRKLMLFRDYLIRQSGLFEVKDDDEENEEDATFKPTAQTVQAVRTMAMGISKLLATPVEEEPATVKDEVMADASSPSPVATSANENDSSGGVRKRKR